MKFIDKDHKEFWKEKYNLMKNMGKTDVYYSSLVYVLGICPETREHFNRIFDLKEGLINIDCLQDAWQTSSSGKTTRMAFSLWNTCCFDSDEECENRKASRYYTQSEIFSCGYAPYFFEGIKIRYPEYTKSCIGEQELEPEM